ncbi:hypothetical protein AAFC00_003567 [Neodothiora populina]|uniref:Fungal lipase-type domain-containing protein n=1 Tax=Neodothiora populina TaxID=2781224 RepID=A0ABR3PF41_9PEZI
MRFTSLIYFVCSAIQVVSSSQIPLVKQHVPTSRAVSPHLFSELEELARVVDITYCVGLGNTGISKPFTCLGRCSDFPDFELVKTWNTGPLMSDSCGYLALDHSAANPRIIVAFRGTYSIANAVVDLSTVPQEYVPYPGDPSSTPEGTPPCHNCTVHGGFDQSWRVTSPIIQPELETLLAVYPKYTLHLVGHSLGGAVAALAGLDFLSQGWHPLVTTFGEPRIGNQGLMNYVDHAFQLNQTIPTSPGDGSAWTRDYEEKLMFRRVTHVDDPVPQLPLTEWGFRMHAGEIFIAKSELSPDIQDVHHCFGDQDPTCIASQDPSLLTGTGSAARSAGEATIPAVVRKASLWKSMQGGITIPARYKLWQMLFAHRDYFWRLGLCVPPGSPWGWKQGVEEQRE